MIKILEREFTNTITGVSSTVYKSDAGDATECRYLIEEKIFFENVNGVSFTIDQANNKIYISGGDWELGGLLSGDTVKMYHAGSTHTQTVVSVTPSTLELNDIHNSIIQGDFLQIEGWGVNRTSVNIFINHAFQSAGFTRNSHIDLEKTGLKLDDIPLTGIHNFVQFGNQSGQFKVVSANIASKIATESGGTWEIILTVINSGIYAPQIQDPLQDFNFIFAVQFFRINANPNTAELKIDNYLSNIGWFGMGYGDEPADGVVSVPINNMRYNLGQSLQAQITGASMDLLGFGASYIPTDNAYYKNKPINQSELGMIVETTPTATGLITGTNSFEAGTPSWSLEVTGTTYNPTTDLLIIDFDWQPAFNGFMDNRDDDRLFYVWAKVGNTNHLLYEGQLTKEPTPNEEITPDFFQVATFEEQITTPISNDNEKAVIEDNLSMLVKIPLVQDDEYQSVKALVYLEKTATSEKVVLSSQNFNLSNTPYINGAYVGSQTFQTSNNLASGSVKNNATLLFDALIGANYKATVNYPFLINWRYWLPLSSMFNTFYPNQNNDWDNYLTAGYKFWMEVQLLKPDGSYAFTREELTFDDYDAEGKVDCQFTLKRQDGTPTTHILDEPMTIEVVHTGTTVTPTLSALDFEFTIEPKESNPRWQISTEYAETNPNNPLSIVSNVIVAGVATTVIAIDTTKLDISGGVSISAEVKGLVGADPILNRHKESFEYFKIPVLGEQSEARCDEGCCEVQIKVASTTDSKPENNDTTAVYYKSDGLGTIDFDVWKDGVLLEAIPMNSPVAESFLNYGQIDWKTILIDYGTGCYVVKYSGTVAGIDFNGIWGKYQLLEYSCELVRDHVRIRTYFDKYSKKEDINFLGTGLYDDVRITGTFGEMQPKQRSEIIMYGDDLQRMANQENRPEYKLNSKLVEPIKARLIIGNLLKATDIFISEYNPISPDFLNYENVILSPENSIDLEYAYGTRKRGINIVVSKKSRNERVYRK